MTRKMDSRSVRSSKLSNELSTMSISMCNDVVLIMIMAWHGVWSIVSAAWKNLWFGIPGISAGVEMLMIQSIRLFGWLTLRAGELENLGLVWYILVPFKLTSVYRSLRYMHTLKGLESAMNTTTNWSMGSASIHIKRLGIRPYYHYFPTQRKRTQSTITEDKRL